MCTNADHHFLNCLRTSHEKMFVIVRIPMKRVTVKDHMTPADVAFLVANFIHESLSLMNEEEGEVMMREIMLRRETE